MSSETHIFMKTCHFNVSTLSIAFVIYNSKTVMDICQLTKSCHVQKNITSQLQPIITAVSTLKHYKLQLL